MLFKRKSLLIIGLLLCLIIGISAVSASSPSLADDNSNDVDFLTTDLSQNDTNNINSLLGSNLDEEDYKTPTLGAYTKTITVGSSGCDYTNIKSAIAAASSGTEIIIHGGTYKGTDNRGLTISLSNVKIGAALGEKVIIDCEGKARFIEITGGTVVISGLKITNGYNQYGGGLQVSGGNNHVIESCYFHDCKGSYGATFRFDSSSITNLTIKNCNISDAVASVRGGVALILFGSD